MDADRALVTKVVWTGRGLDEILAAGVTPDKLIHEDLAKVLKFVTVHAEKYGRIPSVPVVVDEFPQVAWEQTDESLDYLIERWKTMYARRLSIEFIREELAPMTNELDKIADFPAMLRRHADQLAFLGHEDSLGIQRARLAAVGADVERVGFLRGRNSTILTLPTDAAEIERQIRTNNIGCLFIDPVNSHVDAGIRTSDDKDMRTALSPLALIAQETDCIIVVVHHFSKGTAGGKLLYRLGGSMAYSGVARSVLALGRKDPGEANGGGAEEKNVDDVGRDEDDPNARFLFQTGSNYSEDKAPIRFVIETREVKVADGTDQVGAFTYWGEDHHVTQADVFTNSNGQLGRPRDESVREWLNELLNGRDEISTQELYDAAHADGHGDRNIRNIMRRELKWEPVRGAKVWRAPGKPDAGEAEEVQGDVTAD